MKYLRKFNESVETSNFITDPDEIRRILIDEYVNSPAPAIRLYGVGFDVAIDISDDGVVHSEKAIGYLGSRVGAEMQGHLPFRYGVVHEYFDLRKCNITTLEGSPIEVRGNYILGNNPITSLEGCPKTITGKFMMENLSITDLKNGPQSAGLVSVKNCKNLTSLEGLPTNTQYVQVKDGCPNLWDPKGLRDVKSDNLEIEAGAPIFTLRKIFGKDFGDSLDYNYVRGKIRDKDFNVLPSINLFRFKEALDEFGIETEEYDYKSVHPKGQLESAIRFIKDGSVIYETWTYRLGFDYVFSDDDGKNVDFNGDRL